MILHYDLETFSACDLKSAGLDNYSKHHTTGVHCAAFAFGDEQVDIWVRGERCPERVREHIEQGGLVYAHNAPFEIALTNNVLARKHGWPVLKPEQMRCTMSMAYAQALPGALEDVAPALGIAQRKDATGKRVMLQLCQPRADGEFWNPHDAPEKFKALYDYCKQDVEVERAIHKRLMELSAAEQRLWTLDYHINQRGVRVDLKLIEKALRLVAVEKERLDSELRQVTGNAVARCTEVAQLVKWARFEGVDLTGLAKADVSEALTRTDLPPKVRRALELRKEAAKSSIAKLAAMKERAGKDGRIRGVHQYHGAATGRWAGRGVQMQNLGRPVILSEYDVEEVLDLIRQVD